jgi:hypothetical protein
MNDELKKELDGSGRGLTKVLYLHVTKGIEGNNDGSPSGYLLLRLRFETSTVRYTVLHHVCLVKTEFR